jgi:hypothetical protein
MPSVWLPALLLLATISATAVADDDGAMTDDPCYRRAFVEAMRLARSEGARDFAGYQGVARKRKLRECELNLVYEDLFQ